MRTAILALFVSFGLLAMLAVGSFFGYPYLPERFHAKVPDASQPTTQKQADGGRALEPVEVPSGTFHGPTGQPTLIGPSGPPPEE